MPVDFDQMAQESHPGQNQAHAVPHPHAVCNSAISGASVLFKQANFTPAGMIVNQHQITEDHRENMNVNAWNLDDHDTQTAHLVDTLIGNSAQTISEEQLRQHNSSSQQRSAPTEGEMDLLHPNYQNQQQQYI